MPHSWDLIVNPSLVDNFDKVIKEIVSKGRKGTIVDKFLQYVTGYASFFNEDDPAWNEVTFARTDKALCGGRSDNGRRFE